MENTIEGFISIARLPDGRYEYDENHYMIRGNGKTYRIGDKIEIRVVSTDIVLRRIDFELSDFHKEVDAFDEGMKASVNRKQFREEAKEERSGKRKNRGNKSQTNDEKYRRHKNKGLNSRKKRKKKKK